MSARIRPLVSVVIPCYNYARYLPAAVSSVLNQTDVDVEIILVDDASSDGSAQLALDFAAADRRIQAVLHTKNQGHIATYNDGLSHVSGDYVVLLSADDMLASGSLSRSTALMEAHPEIGLVYGYALYFEGQPPTVPRKRTTWSRWSGDSWIRLMCKRGENIITNPEAVVRRSVMDQLVGYRTDMPQAADMDLWLRAAALSGVGRINGPVQAFYRIHGNNMHLTSFAGLLRDAQARRQVFDELPALPGRPLTQLEELRRTARHAIAVGTVRSANQALFVEGRDSSVAADLANFAVETDPTVTGSAAWKSYCARQSGRLTPFQQSLSAEAYRWRCALRWRRWRRYGI